MKTRAVVLLLVLAGHIYARQPVYVSTADSLRQTGSQQAALREYGSIFAKSPHDERNYYGFACALAADAQYSEAYKYLYLATDAVPSLQPLTDPALLNLHMNEGWQTYQTAVIKKVTAKYGNIPQLDIARKLWEMKALDGLYDREIAILNNTMGKDAMIINLLLRTKGEINLNNQKKLSELVNANGWPRISTVGKEAADAAAVIVTHAAIGIKKKYLPQIKAACSEKEAGWEYYAFISDQVLTGENKKQLYGTQVIYNFVTGRYSLLPLEDPANADKRRRELGLEPLGSYLAQWNISPPPTN